MACYVSSTYPIIDVEEILGDGLKNLSPLTGPGPGSVSVTWCKKSPLNRERRQQIEQTGSHNAGIYQSVKCSVVYKSLLTLTLDVKLCPGGLGARARARASAGARAEARAFLYG